MCPEPAGASAGFSQLLGAQAADDSRPNVPIGQRTKVQLPIKLFREPALTPIAEVHAVR